MSEKTWRVRAVLQDVTHEQSREMLLVVDGTSLILRRQSEMSVAGDDGGLLQIIVPVERVVFFAKVPPDDIVPSSPSLLVQCEPDAARLSTPLQGGIREFFYPSGSSVIEPADGVEGLTEQGCVSLRIVPSTDGGSRSDPPPAVVHEMWEACCEASIAVDEEGNDADQNEGDADHGCSRLLQVLRNSAAEPPVGFKRTRD